MRHSHKWYGPFNPVDILYTCLYRHLQLYVHLPNINCSLKHGLVVLMTTPRKEGHEHQMSPAITPLLTPPPTALFLTFPAARVHAADPLPQPLPTVLHPKTTFHFLPIHVCGHAPTINFFLENLLSVAFLPPILWTTATDYRPVALRAAFSGTSSTSSILRRTCLYPLLSSTDFHMVCTDTATSIHSCTYSTTSYILRYVLSL